VHREICGAVVADDLAGCLLLVDEGGSMEHVVEGILGAHSQSLFIVDFCWCNLLIQSAHPYPLDEILPSLLRRHKVHCSLRVSNCFSCKATLHLSYRRLAVAEKELLHGLFGVRCIVLETG
jgi:hypothetical protein